MADLTDGAPAPVASSAYHILLVDAGKTYLGAILKRHSRRGLTFVAQRRVANHAPDTDRAEYQALIMGLELARRKGVRHIRVFSDRHSLAEQMTKGKPGKADPQLFKRARELADRFKPDGKTDGR
jgi:ribonuclease HI